MKAFAIFSFLFGVGLAIQYERLARRGRPFYWLLRRLVVLLVFGLAHLLLIWNGDILTEYALAGLLILPFIAASRQALAVGATAMFTLYIALAVVPLPIPWPDQAWLHQHIEEATRMYGAGQFVEIVRFSMQEIPALLPLHIYVFPRTLALLLLGALAWKSGILRRPQEHRQLIGHLAWLGIAGGVMLTALDASGLLDSWHAFGPIRTIVKIVTPVVLATGYGAAILWLAEWPAMRHVLKGFAALGRMAFTNYVLQSVIFGLVFFGYGLGQFGRLGAVLGQFGRLGAVSALLLGIGVYVAQGVFSAWWLRRYRFGPLEWLWRTWMYGRMQPMALTSR